jgi:hypothetical protein
MEYKNFYGPEDEDDNGWAPESNLYEKPSFDDDDRCDDNRYDNDDYDNDVNDDYDDHGADDDTKFDDPELD